jgi:hypothetical protein
MRKHPAARERAVHRNKARRQTDLAKHSAYNRDWADKNPGKAKRAELKHALKKYGITLDEYDRLFHSQGGVCRICRLPDPTGRRLSVDHDHKTGRVRGLLCHKHNTALGGFNDDLILLQAAIDYLKVEN